MSDHIVDANKMTTPRTDDRIGQITIENEDSCCAIYAYIDGKEYDGDLVDADFARQLERELAEANKLVAAYETEISKEMPPDFKDWWENDKSEWPLVARLVLENRRNRNELYTAD